MMNHKDAERDGLEGARGMTIGCLAVVLFLIGCALISLVVA